MKSLILVIHAFRDLFIQLLPRFKKGRGFAFLVHPRDISDVYRKYPFAKRLPDNTLLTLLKFFWPVVVSEVTGLRSLKSSASIKGWVITIPLTAHQMMEDRKLAVKKILRGAKLARNMGANLIGLGALTASLSKGGLDIKPKVDINITTGHAFTGYTVTSNFLKLAEIFEITEDKKTKVWVAIVGAAGSIGSICAQIIAENRFNNFILVDRELKKKLLDKLVPRLRELNENINLEISHQIGSIQRADFIITATNAPEALIKPDDLKSGAVIIDDAQPSDISPEVLERDDVLVVDGGLVHMPDIETHADFGLRDKYDNFCCLAEVLILVSHEWTGHYVLGRCVNLESVKRIAKFASHTNFRLAEFQNRKGAISEDQLARIKKIVQNNLALAGKS